MKGVFSILIFALSLFSGLLSYAEEAYNCDDPKCQQEKARLSNPTTMNAQFLSRGIPCETGACFKDADSAMGFDVTPLINVEGSATVEPRVSPADVVK
jgi:hypothetical protein